MQNGTGATIVYILFAYSGLRFTQSSRITTNASQNRLTLDVKIDNRIVCAEVSSEQINIRHGMKCQCISKICKHVRLDIGTE